MDAILISGVPGTKLDDCASSLAISSAAKSTSFNSLGPIRVEDAFVEVSEVALRKYRPEVTGRKYRFTDCLTLPYPEFMAASIAAIGRTLVKINALQEELQDTASHALITFHSVYYHQVVLEFIHPYTQNSLVDFFKEHGISPKYVISIHDDLFDIHRRLMEHGEMFCPEITERARKYKRATEQDLFQQMLILSWRDRELSASRLLAHSLGAKHFLFHKKGRVSSLVDVVYEEKCNVYFSHPISQPRRDVNGIRHETKCRETNPERGRKLIESCQEIADLLGNFSAIVEPTAIDEYRLDLKKLNNWSESKHLLSRAVLPPLSWRWPIGQGDRLGGRPVVDDPANPLAISVPFPEDTSYGGQKLDYLKSACEMLFEEIRRQITIRDNILAGQADLVFAYRPFCLPDSPEPTGGVAKEMEIIRMKASVEGARVKPALVIYHPEEDERVRRLNVLEQEWKKISGRLNFSSEDHHAEVKNGLRALIGRLDARNSVDVSLLRVSLHTALKELKVTAKPLKDEGTMAEGEYIQSDKALDAAVEFIVSRPEMLISNIERMAMNSDGLIEVIKEIQNPVTLGRRIKKLLEGENGSEKRRQH